jgi:hypothetical protein
MGAGLRSADAQQQANTAVETTKRFMKISFSRNGWRHHVRGP